MRHGETDWNLTRKIQGITDNPLNANGQNQALRGGEILSKIHFDKCFCSPLIRARQTAAAVMAHQRCEFEIDDDLREISYGVLEGTPLEYIYSDENCPLHNYFLATERYEPPEGGESITALFKRSGRFLSKISKLKGLENILAVCHGSLIRGLVSVSEGLPSSEFWNCRNQKNCSITLLQYNESRWHIVKESIDILSGEALDI